MNITYDPKKRAKTLAERGLDFEHAPRVFAGRRLQIEDDRHIISMRKCNDREKKKYVARLGGSG